MTEKIEMEVFAEWGCPACHEAVLLKWNRRGTLEFRCNGEASGSGCGAIFYANKGGTIKLRELIGSATEETDVDDETEEEASPEIEVQAGDKTPEENRESEPPEDTSGGEVGEVQADSQPDAEDHAPEKAAESDTAKTGDGRSGKRGKKRAAPKGKRATKGKSRPAGKRGKSGAWWVDD